MVPPRAFLSVASQLDRLAAPASEQNRAAGRQRPHPQFFPHGNRCAHGPLTPEGAAVHSVDGDTVNLYRRATQDISVYPAVHNVDSSLCQIRGTDWYARFGRYKLQSGKRKKQKPETGGQNH